MTDPAELLEHALLERCPTCAARPGVSCYTPDDSQHPARLAAAMRVLDARDQAITVRSRGRDFMAGAPRLDRHDRPTPGRARAARERCAPHDDRFTAAGPAGQRR